MAKAVKHAETHKVFKSNPEVLMSVNEVFYDHRKADQFCHWPESMVEHQVKKELGDAVILDEAQKERQAEKERQLANINQTRVRVTRREKQKSRERRKDAIEPVSPSKDSSNSDKLEGDEDKDLNKMQGGGKQFIDKLNAQNISHRRSRATVITSHILSLLNNHH